MSVESEGPLPVEFMDAETGSRWNMLGEAIAGPLAGRRLAQVPAYNAMWFAWTAYWPDTEVWQPGEGILSQEDIEQIEQATAVVEVSDAAPTSFALRQKFSQPVQRPDADPVRTSSSRASAAQRVQRGRTASALAGRRAPSGRAVLAALGRARRRRAASGQRCVPIPIGSIGICPSADDDDGALTNQT